MNNYTEKTTLNTNGVPTYNKIPWLGVELNRGIQTYQMFTLFYAAFASICGLVFVNGSLPFLLTNFLNITESEQGRVIGNILLWNEVVVISTITFWGIISDYIGRRRIYVLSFMLMCISICMHPLMDSVPKLIAVRCVFALGSSASMSMLIAALGDYSTSDSRGKAGGAVGFLAGCGALLTLFVFLRIPLWVTMNDGDDFLSGGKLMYWCIGFFFIFSTIIISVGLSGHNDADDLPHENIYHTVKHGCFGAVRNPKIALAYMASFSARGDAILLTSFLSLWITQWENNNGGTPQETLMAVGTITGVAQLMALLFAPLFGIICDVLDRTVCTTIAAFIAMIGYFCVSMLSNPTSTGAKFAIAFVGIGEIGMIICSQILVSSESPEKIRGAISGLFGLFGSISILVCSKISGYIFDKWHPGGPFLFVSLLNMVVFAFGFALIIVKYFRTKEKVASFSCQL